MEKGQVKNPDIGKWIRVSNYLLLIIFLCFYGYFQGKAHDITIEKLLKAPDKYHLKTIYLEYQGVKKINHKIYMKQTGYFIELKNMPDWKIAYLEKVSIKGIFHREGYIQVKQFRIHKYFWVVMFSGAVAVILVLIIFLYHFCFNFQKFEFYRR